MSGPVVLEIWHPSGWDTHSSTTQPVTASPSAKHFDGSGSLSLQAKYALFAFEQRKAMCFETDISKADVGGGALGSAMLLNNN
jgi:hypothetical protein